MESIKHESAISFRDADLIGFVSFNRIIKKVKYEIQSKILKSVINKFMISKLFEQSVKPLMEIDTISEQITIDLNSRNDYIAAPSVEIIYLQKPPNKDNHNSALVKVEKIQNPKLIDFNIPIKEYTIQKLGQSKSSIDVKSVIHLKSNDKKSTKEVYSKSIRRSLLEKMDESIITKKSDKSLNNPNFLKISSSSLIAPFPRKRDNNRIVEELKDLDINLQEKIVKHERLMNEYQAIQNLKSKINQSKSVSNKSNTVRMNGDKVTTDDKGNIISIAPSKLRECEISFLNASNITIRDSVYSKIEQVLEQDNKKLPHISNRKKKVNKEINEKYFYPKEKLCGSFYFKLNPEPGVKIMEEGRIKYNNREDLNSFGKFSNEDYENLKNYFLHDEINKKSSKNLSKLTQSNSILEISRSSHNLLKSSIIGTGNMNSKSLLGDLLNDDNSQDLQFNNKIYSYNLKQKANYTNIAQSNTIDLHSVNEFNQYLILNKDKVTNKNKAKYIKLNSFKHRPFHRNNRDNTLNPRTRFK